MNNQKLKEKIEEIIPTSLPIGVTEMGWVKIRQNWIDQAIELIKEEKVHEIV